MNIHLILIFVFLTLYINFLPLLHFDDGEKSLNKNFGCALVVGIEKAPLKVAKSMGAKRIARRSQVKPFIKVINYNHVMPTRYNLDLEFPSVTVESVKDAATKKEVKKTIRKTLEEKYKTGQNKWFFQKLRF
jgi:large subunit ribosomal protein L27e